MARPKDMLPWIATGATAIIAFVLWRQHQDRVATAEPVSPQRLLRMANP